MSWKQAFNDTLLYRGKSYYERGLVENLRKEPDGWHATVQGSWPYDVVVAVSSDGQPNPTAEQTSCSCPYFAEAHLCKHVAATCLAIEHGTTTDSAPSDASNWQPLLQALSADDCRDFLRTTLTRDAQLRDEFLARFGKLDTRNARRAIQSGFSAALYNHSDGYGYVDYHHSFAFETEICTSIRHAVRPYLDRKAWQFAFDVSILALQELQHLDVVGPDGVHTAAQDVCLDIWRAIIAQGGDEGAAVVAAGIPMFLASEPDEGDECECDYDVFDCQISDAAEFFLDTFQDDRRHASDVYAWCRQALLGHDHCIMWNGEQRCTLAGLRALRTMGRPVDELVSFAKPHLAIPPVRIQIANELTEHSMVDEAVQLLREGLRSCERPVGVVTTYEALLNCYKLQGNQDATRQCLIELVTHADKTQDARTWWHELRELTDEACWAQASESLLKRMQITQVRYALLAEEGHVDELMEQIEKRKDVQELMNYDRLLVTAHPQRVMRLYHNKVMDDLERASSRNGYRAALRYLQHMGTLPESSDMFSRTAQQIRTTYPRRPALHDELRKIGG